MFEATITLETFQFTDSPDPDANFKRDVAYYTRIDPMPTLQGMSRNLGVPVGAVAKYVLVKWAASGSEGIMEIGPLVLRQMRDIVREAESHGDDAHRLAAYQKLAKIVSWLNFPLDHPLVDEKDGRDMPPPRPGGEVGERAS